MSPGQVASVVYNETRSLSGPGIQDARTNMAQAIMNGDDALGEDRPITAPDTADIPVGEVETFDMCLDADAAARQRRADGYDPTNNARNFNMRNQPSTKPFFGMTPQTINGPFSNSFPTQTLGPNVYVNTYR